MPTKYHRTLTDGRNAVQCSCGATIKARGMTLHKRGAGHRQRKRIRALLDKACISHREIARRCNVHFERVRQIANSLGAKSGMDRIKTCSIRRVAKAAQDLMKSHDRLKKLIDTCERSGMQIEFIPSVHQTVSDPIFRAKVLIEGRVCALRSAAGSNDTVVIKRPLVNPEIAFVCYPMPDGRWLVVPRDRLPQSNTSFRPNVHQVHSGTHRHDWQGYIEAWDLLRRRAVAA